MNSKDLWVIYKVMIIFTIYTWVTFNCVFHFRYFESIWFKRRKCGFRVSLRSWHDRVFQAKSYLCEILWVKPPCSSVRPGTHVIVCRTRSNSNWKWTIETKHARAKSFTLGSSQHRPLFAVCPGEAYNIICKVSLCFYCCLWADWGPLFGFRANRTHSWLDAITRTC